MYVSEAVIYLNFLERIKSMSKIQRAVSEIKSIEELANEDRWVNQVHPLVKLCVTILYIGTVVSFSKYNLSGLLVMAVYPVILFIMNEISVKDALWRMRVVLPLVCVAGIFNPFFDRQIVMNVGQIEICLLYTSPSPRDISGSRMPSSA